MAASFQLPDPAPVDSLPGSAEALEALRQADRAQLAEALEQQIEQRVEQRLAAEIERRVATEVAYKVQEILEQQTLLRHRMFGRSSQAHAGQGQLFNEVELEASAISEGEATGSTDPPETRPDPKQQPARRRGKRKPLPPELPRIEHVVDVPEHERQCDCGTPMVQIGEDVSEQLDIVPMTVRVIRTIRPRYGCPKGEHAPTVAPAVPTVLPRSNFSAGLLAMMLTVKYADGLPLNRLAKVLARHGVMVPRQSLARAVIETSKVLQPLFNLARDTLLDSAVIHMDETPVQVLKEPDKPPASQSYMWVQRGGPPKQPVILFDYDPSRSGEVPKQLLEGWQGYLMTDDYSGYNAIACADGIEHLTCMAHARRKFVEAKQAQPKNKAGRADTAIDYFARLYHIESEVKKAQDGERLRARQERSWPVLQAFKAWLDQTLPQVTPRSKLGQALAYLHSVWPKLIRYTERGDLPIDNNPCENAIRPFVVGRKGWLFADTPAGAHASAVIYSLIETAKANDQEPYAWLRYVLERLPMAKTVADMEALMPWNVHAQDLAMNLAACE
jgi:transposase